MRLYLPQRRQILFRFSVWDSSSVIIALLISIPLLIVASSIFVPSGDTWEHIRSTVLARYISNTLCLSLGVGILTLLIGISTSWLVAMCKFPGRAIFEWALLLPMAMPAYAIAYTYGGILDYAGPIQSFIREIFDWTRNDYWFPSIRSLEGAIIVLGFVLYPYVYILSRSAFIEQSVCSLEVGRTLGSKPWKNFFYVALPLARPAIVAGLALVIMETLGDFGAVQYLAVDTFATGIFRTWYGLGDLSAALQLALILLGLVFLLLTLERISRGKRRYHHTSTHYRQLPRYSLSSVGAFLAFALCFLPILVGFLLPVSFLIFWSLETAPYLLDKAFISLLINSASLAIAASLIVVIVSIFICWVVRIRPGFLVSATARISSLGYAVPGMVISLGILISFAWLDNNIDAWARSMFGISTGLILSGTLIALLFAYLVRFLAIAINAVEVSLGKIPNNIDSAAFTLGSTPGSTLRKIHLPLMKSSLLAAGLLVFVDVMKELPATLVLRPFNFNTLAVRTYELASQERLADAAIPALFIVLAGLLPVILISSAMANSRPGRTVSGSK